MPRNALAGDEVEFRRERAAAGVGFSLAQRSPVEGGRICLERRGRIRTLRDLRHDAPTRNETVTGRRSRPGDPNRTQFFRIVMIKPRFRPNYFRRAGFARRPASILNFLTLNFARRCAGIRDFTAITDDGRPYAHSWLQADIGGLAPPANGFAHWEGRGSRREALPYWLAAAPFGAASNNAPLRSNADHQALIRVKH